MKPVFSCIPSILFLAVALSSPAAQVDEFKIKREAVFEFAAKPQVTRQGDAITVRFESKGYCDATVAIENPAGKIVRHW